MLDIIDRDRLARILEAMPNKPTFNEIMNKIYFVYKIEKSWQQIESGQIFSYEQKEQKLGSQSQSNIDWTLQSLEDMRSTLNFFALQPDRESKLIDDLLRIVKRITYSPDRGRIIPEFNQNNLRESICLDRWRNQTIIHRIGYQIDRDCIQILTIFNVSRKFDEYDLGKTLLPPQENIDSVKLRCDRLFRKRT
ncbi:MAG: hypothetical protein AAGA60_19375 [Cyanobacteria bacterium P01_E01_bin.42]